MRNTKFSVSWLFVLCISAPVLCTLAGDAVPVLIWGGDSLLPSSNRVNPLQKTTESEFDKIVAKLIGTSQPPILIFTRDSFCVEDIGQHKKDLGTLKKSKFFRYLPAVESPLSAFEKLSTYNQSIEEELESISDGQLIMTKATDLDSIAETYNLMKQWSPRLFGFLTGRSCSHNKSDRIKRQATEPPKTDKKAAPVVKDPFVIFLNGSFLLSAEEPPIYQNESLGEVLSVTSEGNWTGNAPYLVNVTFVAGGNAKKPMVTFVLNPKTAGYWYMKQIQVTNEGENPVSLGANVDLVFPRKFGYHCTAGVTFANKTENRTLIFKNLQVQVGVSNFTDAYDCTGFTSIPIWSGIFVTAIIALIIFWGITMIMDIRTMDRFDDPKGKTITISAQE